MTTEEIEKIAEDNVDQEGADYNKTEDNIIEGLQIIKNVSSQMDYRFGIHNLYVCDIENTPNITKDDIIKLVRLGWCIKDDFWCIEDQIC